MAVAVDCNDASHHGQNRLSCLWISYCGRLEHQVSQSLTDSLSTFLARSAIVGVRLRGVLLQQHIEIFNVFSEFRGHASNGQVRMWGTDVLNGLKGKLCEIETGI